MLNRLSFKDVDLVSLVCIRKEFLKRNIQKSDFSPKKKKKNRFLNSFCEPGILGSISYSLGIQKRRFFLIRNIKIQGGRLSLIDYVGSITLVALNKMIFSLIIKPKSYCCNYDSKAI